jgi:hypothetical protein
MQKLFVMTFLLFTSSVWAIDITIFYAKGNVTITDLEGNQQKALKGDIVTEGKKIITGDKSFVIIKIEKHSIHRIEENSNLLVSKLPYQYENSDVLEQGGSFYLEMGTIFSEVFNKSGNDSLEVSTKNTSMGVRGTKLMVSRDLESNQTWLSVEDGEVEIKNSISNHHDVVTKKQSIVVESDREFTKPRLFDWHNKVSWDIEKSKDDLKTFKAQKKLAFMEHNKKKAKWIRDEVKFGLIKSSWKQRKKKWSEKIKLLKSNTKLKKRKSRLEARLKKMTKKKGMPKSTRDLYRGIQDSRGDLKLNDFANEKLDTSREKMRNKKRRLEIMNEKRRRLSVPKNSNIQKTFNKSDNGSVKKR